jgi:hypothetical protein
MVAFFSPRFSGSVRIQTAGTEFLDRFRRRIEAGFLTGMPHWRSHYVVTQYTDRGLTFRAADFLTAINIGINQVELRIPQEQCLEYTVTYRRWAASCVALCGLIGLLGAVLFFLFPDLRAEVRRGGTAVFWGMVAFWGFVWPWLLVALHKPFAKRCLNRVLTEVDSQAA